MLRKTSNKTFLLGAHFSIAGGLHKAIESAVQYQCKTFQVFTKSPRTWVERPLSPREIDRFRSGLDQHKMTTPCAHGIYLINLASPDKKNWHRSKKALIEELRRSALLNIPYVIIHPGAHLGSGVHAGLERIASAVREVFIVLPDNPCRLLLETTSGQGTDLGCTFEQLNALQEMIDDKNRLGFCLDTAHIFSAGFDLRTPKTYRKTLQHIEHAIGIHRIYALHLNDTPKRLGSNIDRHEHIGKGEIGIEGFRLIMNDPYFKKIPKIIETPKPKGKVDYDRINLSLLRSLVKK